MSSTGDDIAIVGISGRFPQAAGVAELWEKLSTGQECITSFTDEELLAEGVSPELLQNPEYVRANGVVADIEKFDAGFFGFSPRDAELLDPQHRLFIECAWEGLEDAGHVPDRHSVPVGVFAGASLSTYAFQLYNNPALAGLANDFQILISNDKDHLATRVAYKLNLTGPAISIGTACSTSLVATCLAAQSLLDYQCDMALAGGVTLGVPMRRGYLYEEGGISSPDGHCRPFDASAMGTVGGNGCAVLVLKRLDDALTDGDPIRAVIRGWGMNNDGSQKVGYTAPSVQGQTGAIATALAMADVSPDSITMMEAHGTATPLGDPIEFAALTRAWQRASGRQYCALGSLKSNVGHMDSAAGAAGLIKCVLSLQRRQIPPSLHFETAHPALDFGSSPFYVNTELRDWVPAHGTRRAAVSSFGIGGTNAHVIVEEAPASASASDSVPCQLLPLSARSATALDSMAERLAGHLERHPELPLADVAHTLQLGRSEFRHRRVLIAPGTAGRAPIDWLRTKEPRHIISGSCPDEPPGVAFMFPGQGAQHAGMLRGLYRDEPVFRETVERCAGVLAPLLGEDLRVSLFADDGGDELVETRLTQPAVFTVSYALARLWMHWGVRPLALIGHSVGEYTAACLAGVFTLDEALWLVAQRGRILAEMPRGSMLGIMLPEASVAARFSDTLDIAAINGSESCVVAGPDEAIEAARAVLEGEGVQVQLLRTSHAFHSRLMEAAVARTEEAAGKVNLRPPKIPCISNVSGRWLEDDEAQSPAYWGRHVRATVRFSDGLAQLMHETPAHLLEVGPGTTLSTLARRHNDRDPSRLVLPSCRHALDEADDHEVVRRAMARLWIAGSAVDWRAAEHVGGRRRVSLPSYPFERQRFWIDAPRADQFAPQASAHEAKRLPLEHWFYLPRWVRLATLPIPGPEMFAEADESVAWVVCGGTAALAEAFAEALSDVGQQAGRVHDVADIDTADDGQLVVISLDGLQPGGTGFECSLRLLQHLSRRSAPSHVLLLARRLFAVTPADAPVNVETVGLLGPLLVAPQEYPQISCKAVDLDPAAVELLELGHAETLIAEAIYGEASPWIALRSGQRWSLSFEPAPLAPVPTPCAPALTGCYLITGGLGRIGLVVAEWLARKGARAVVLCARSSLPEDDPRADRLAAIEALGTTLLLCRADVADEDSCARMVAEARDGVGHIDGIVHAAGLTGGEYFKDFSATGVADAQPHFAAKHLGVQTLAAALADDPPGFICLMSSISAYLGGVGFAAYAAANAMLDATVTAQRGPVRWLSIDWDGWSFDEAAPDDVLIHADDGVEVLERTLASTDLDHVVVSVRALGPRLEGWVQSHGEGAAEIAVAVGLSNAHERPEMSTGFVPPEPGTATLAAGIWQDLLGLTEIGADDNFFELGGHSLLAIQVISRLRQALARDIPVRMLFDNPTVAELAAALDGMPLDGLAELLDSIEAMPDEEVREKLQDERG